MELTYDSEHWNNAVTEYRIASGFTDEFTMKQINDVYELFHPFNHIDMHDMDTFHIYQQCRDDAHNVFNHYAILSYNISESERIFNPPITQVVKALNNLNGVYCITISPPFTVLHSVFVKFVKSIIEASSVFKVYGVFEVGESEENLHAHFVIKHTNKNGQSNLLKKLVKSNWIYLVKQLKTQTALIKCIRYFHQIDKKNRGIINSPDLAYWLDLAEDISSIYFKPYNGKTYNIDRL